MHEPSNEHDLGAGLRDNFDARAHWRSAILSARVLAKFSQAKQVKEDALKHVFSDSDEDNLHSDENQSFQEEQQEKLNVQSRDPKLAERPPVQDESGPQLESKESVTPPQTQTPEAEQSVVPSQELDPGQRAIPTSLSQRDSEEFGEYLRMPGSFDFNMEDENHQNQDHYISVHYFGRILGDLLERLRLG
jgi:calcium/calmodulin-dependent protein kinase I